MTAPLGLFTWAIMLALFAIECNCNTDYQTYILIADQQALTDHWKTPEILQENIIEVTLDYLAAGISPETTTICVQVPIARNCRVDFVLPQSGHGQPPAT